MDHGQLASLQRMVPVPETELCHIVPSLEGQLAHQMQGVPTWMAVAGLGLVIVLSHVLLAHREKEVRQEQRPWRLGLLHLAPLRALVHWPSFPLAAQSLSMALLLLIVAAGLFGSQRHNIATVLTWTWWWALLVFVIAGLGKAFCAVCPWEGLASLITSLSLKSRVKKLGFEFRWPRSLRNLYPALGLFVALTWLELGYEVTYSPSFTAVLGLGMAALAVLGALLFEKRSFCRYACLVGRVSGLYALFSPLELRAESGQVCQSCQSKACLQGHGQQGGCPLFLFPGRLRENAYCTLCTECVRACPHHNLDLRLRPFAADLLEKAKRFRRDEAVLAMVLLALTSFHGVTMTPQWERFNDWLRVFTGLDRLAVFTALMAGMMALPLLLFWGSATLARALVGGELKAGQVLKAFAYPLIPVALFYHLAHNGMHFFMEGQNLLPLLSDPLGWGWDLFGTAGNRYGPWLSLEKIWWLQVGLIVAGHAYGVLVADRVGRRLFQGRVLRGLLPFVAAMVFYSGFSIWLIAQPMVMRTGF
jgi:ferredoxin